MRATRRLHTADGPKGQHLAFRIPDQLKRDLQQIAGREARSVSQICEIFLTLGVEAYRGEGPTHIQRVLRRTLSN